MHYTDQAYLRERQYKDATNLDARIALHQRFGQRVVNFRHWVFDRLKVPETSRVLELGCGPGSLWLDSAERIPAGWKVTLSDLSGGMIEEAKVRLKDVPHDFAFALVDAQEIPFEDDLFDVVLANHMLYHVPDVKRTLAEICRVLQPDGRFYAALNGEAHLQELSELAAYLMDGASLRIFRELFGSQTFRLEDGEALLKANFYDVKLHHLEENDLLVTEAEPLIAFILSIISAETFRREPEREVEQQTEAFRSYLEKRIADEGSIHITRAVGLLEAHSPK